MPKIDIRDILSTLKGGYHMDNHKIEIWKERMRACKASGISVLQYCKNNHLSKAGSKGAEGREYINLIFKLEEEM